MAHKLSKRTVKTPSKKVKKIKAWAALCWCSEPPINHLYTSKAEAEQMSRLDVLPWHRVVPVTLTYKQPPATKRTLPKIKRQIQTKYGVDKLYKLK